MSVSGMWVRGNERVEKRYQHSINYKMNRRGNEEEKIQNKAQHN